jgi:hypothetical protein
MMVVQSAPNSSHPSRWAALSLTGTNLAVYYLGLPMSYMAFQTTFAIIQLQVVDNIEI